MIGEGDQESREGGDRGVVERRSREESRGFRETVVAENGRTADMRALTNRNSREGEDDGAWRKSRWM